MARWQRTVWNVQDADLEWDEARLTGTSEPAMVSGHFVRMALHRRRVVVLLATMAGLLTSVAWLMVAPGGHRATAELVMAHYPHADPAVAMATDVRLASARPVAVASIARLGLHERPETFAREFKATATTSDLLTFSATADSDTKAERRLNAFVAVYLAFRSKQLRDQSNLELQSMNGQISALQQQADNLSAEIDDLPIQGSGRRSDLITLRAHLMGEIQQIQGTIQDSTLTTETVIAGTRVVDSVAATRSGGHLRQVQVLVPGAVSGGAIGIGAVLFLAIVSDRLRRRIDVAMALDVPVVTSAGRLRPLPRAVRRLPGFARLDRARAVERLQLARVIGAAIPPPGTGQWLVVGCVDNADETQFAVVAASQERLEEGYVVHLIDLTDDGGLADAVRRMGVHCAPGQLTVSHPRVMAALASDPSDIQTFGTAPGQESPWRPEDIFLTVTDLSPDTTADHLSSWADLVVVSITAGRSTASHLRAVADRVRSADMEICAAVLLHADRNDESSSHASQQLRVSGDAERLSHI